MEQLADALTRTLGREVVDRTELRGRYDFDLHWRPDPELTRGNADGPAAADGPSIFTAVEEQLGLRLEAGRGPTQVLVIDRLEKPDAN